MHSYSKEFRVYFEIFIVCYIKKGPTNAMRKVLIYNKYPENSNSAFFITYFSSLFVCAYLGALFFCSLRP